MATIYCSRFNFYAIALGTLMTIKLKFVFGFIPVPVFYTDFGFDPKGTVAGEARSVIIRIRPKYINDEGILQHELNHIKQFYLPILLTLPIMFGLWYYLGYFDPVLAFVPAIGMLIHPLMYLLIERYRLWSEVDSYKIQLKYYADKVEKMKKFAYFISTKYRLHISETDALILLSK